jgi:hypothetical protein
MARVSSHAGRLTQATDARVFEQCNQHLIEAAGTVDGEFEMLALLAVELLGETDPEQLQVTGDHSQRLAQIVRNGVAELLEFGVRALQLLLGLLAFGDVLSGSQAAQRSAVGGAAQIRLLANMAHCLADHDPVFVLEDRARGHCRLPCRLDRGAVVRRTRAR